MQDVSFQKPAILDAFSQKMKLTRAYNYFTQPNIISQTISNYASSLRREFEQCIAVRSTIARVWARSAPNYSHI